MALSGASGSGRAGVAGRAGVTRPRMQQTRLAVRAGAGGGNGQATATGRTTIHRLIEEAGILMVPGCYDALSAKVLAGAGHKAAFVSGYAVSATLLGEPDLGLLTPPEMARKAGQIVTAVPGVPVLVDADTGGGNVLNVQRTVRQLISVGAKGCFLEDQVWPKKAGHMRNKEVISMEEFAGKVSAAREAIGDADFFLVARTDARGVNAKYGLEDAITRANLYADAGADALYVEAPISKQELAIIGQKVKGLRLLSNLEGGMTPLLTPAEAADLGFHIITYPLSGIYAATKALQTTYGTLASAGSTRESLGSLTAFGEFNDLIGVNERLAAEARLTRREGEKLVVRVRGPTKPV
ncbi:carboxyvinyl-carboxyphosphonate phosphorylmutase [Scenedesmus sp. PABB004]|nr:carboxyvinyl-carboxyphosphonate phosphorylmutase [Scenedesmus sp. PABB004]